MDEFLDENEDFAGALIVAGNVLGLVLVVWLLLIA